MGFLEAVGQASPAILSNIGQMKQMAIQDQNEKREAIKFDYLQKKMSDEEAKKNRPVPMTMLKMTPLATQYPTAFNTLTEHARSQGSLYKNPLTGEEEIKAGDLQDVLGTMELGNKVGNQIMVNVWQDARNNLLALQAEKTSGKIKKPEDLAEHDKKIAHATAEFAGITAMLSPEFYEKTQALKARARQDRPMQVGSDKALVSPTGEVLYRGPEFGKAKDSGGKVHATESTFNLYKGLGYTDEEAEEKANSTKGLSHQAFEDKVYEDTYKALLATGDEPNVAVTKARDIARQARMERKNSMASITGGGASGRDAKPRYIRTAVDPADPSKRVGFNATTRKWEAIQ